MPPTAPPTAAGSEPAVEASHPGKVLGVREDWALAYPNTYVALTKALLEACQFCADPAHWEEMAELLSVSSDIRFWSSGDTKTGPPDGLLMGAFRRPLDRCFIGGCRVVVVGCGTCAA